MKSLPLAMIGILSLLTSSGMAEVLYSNGQVDANAGGTGSDFKTTPDGFFPRQIADSFSLQTASEITGLNWWGGYFPADTSPEQDSFILRIFSDITGNPASSPLFQFAPNSVSRVNTGMSTPAGPDVYSYSLMLPSPVMLDGGTRYWLSIVNDTSLDLDDRWFWGRSGRAANVGIRERLADDTVWRPYSFTNPFRQAFEVNGVAVPEPGSLGWLLGVGAVFLAIRKARVQRK